MKNLANKEIEVLNAITKVNSKASNSFLTGKTIKIGALHFEREDGNFYHTEIDETNYQVFHRFETGNLELDKHISNPRSKTIIINAYRLIEEEVTNIFIEVKGHDLIGVLCVNDKREGFLNYVNKFSSFYDDSEDNKAIKLVYEQAKKFCESKNINLIMY